jgi:hypothetical protein
VRLFKKEEGEFERKAHIIFIYKGNERNDQGNVIKMGLISYKDMFIIIKPK